MDNREGEWGEPGLARCIYDVFISPAIVFFAEIETTFSLLLTLKIPKLLERMNSQAKRSIIYFYGDIQMINSEQQIIYTGYQNTFFQNISPLLHTSPIRTNRELKSIIKIN